MADIEWFEPGRFPFGQSNTQRPMCRAAGKPEALVIGVYPSAFHVRWTPPPEHDTRAPGSRGRSLIGSLAVDVEPVVFWDGKSPSPTDLLERWKAKVGFDSTQHGTVAPGHNGPSGARLEEDIFAPLNLDRSKLAFTDAVPWYFVKDGKGSQREALRERFAPIAKELGVHQGSLPSRPTKRALVELAGSRRRRDGLRSEILESGAPSIITLGDEALGTLRAVADNVDGLPTKLSPDRYGAPGTAEVDGQTFEVRPLVHPGFQRQSKNKAWREALENWPANPR